jgi:Na+/H+ antiporter NhaD/arsenite permease-like protein
MEWIIIAVFLIGYIVIVLEHPLKIDKAATALLTGVLCWVVLVFGLEFMPSYTELQHLHTDFDEFVSHHLAEHLSDIAEILFFLLGAMTIVELMDVHGAFRMITDRITTNDRIKLLWVICWTSFFLSAVLDNLTTTIIMCALVRRIVKRPDMIWFFGGFVIIACNAGGAWSPIGDVTTIMLWIGGQVTTFNIMKATVIPSILCLLVPLSIASYMITRKKSTVDLRVDEESKRTEMTTPFERSFMFFAGSISLLMVPVFKTVTHMPPYMGILLSLGILWTITELIHWRKHPETKRAFSVAQMLQRIDTPSILFFLGILLAVASLEVSGHLNLLALSLDQATDNIYVINIMIGILSAIVDNVPLVAAAMGMYDLSVYHVDHDFWELLAYCAGTGGSMLIIGSAAGVASMGILKINFIWYLKHITLYALIGYLVGVAAYYIQHAVL